MRALFMWAVLLAVGCGPVPPPPTASTPPATTTAPGITPTRTAATVVRVVDGDTVDISVNGRTERVRLIGIDTPETVDPRKSVQCFGREASDKAKELLRVGARIELEADPSQGERDSTPSRRLLRYIWMSDGRHFGQEMIREGYAHEYTFRTPYKYQAEFKAAEREARKQQRGLWSPSTCNGDTTGAATTAQPSPQPPTATTPPPPTSTPRPPTATVAPATPTPHATATATPPPATPTRAPAPVVSPSPAGPRVAFEAVRGAGLNQRASATVRVEPPRAGIECTLRYVTPAGTESDAGGLGTTRTDQDGRASWSWLIGGRTGAGIGRLHVRCGGGDAVSTDIRIT